MKLRGKAEVSTLGMNILNQQKTFQRESDKMQSGMGSQKSHIKGVIDRRRRQQEDKDIHE